MYPYINFEKTGKQIQKYMNQGGYCVQDIQTYLGVSCKQSVYKWLKGKSLPNLEHLCALSYLFHCTLDDLVVTQMNYYVIQRNNMSVFIRRLLMIYLVIINVLGFLIMGLDKAKAKKQKYRISENTLLFVALMGGSLGSYLGMYCFHHKTKHVKFYIGMPLILLYKS